MRLPLKDLNKLFEVDPRSDSYAILDSDVMRRKTIEDHYQDINAINLTNRVPKEIRWEFETIRNLYLYSWFVYEFTVPVFLYVYALIEKMIKTKCSSSGVSLSDQFGS